MRRAALDWLPGVVVVVLGAVVLAVGWWGNVEAARTILPGAVSMKANTAVGMILVGCALLAPRARVGLALLLVLLAASTLLQDLAHVDLGLDHVLASDAGDRWTPSPGRMSPGTAASFVALAAALLAERWRRSLAPWLALLAGSMALVVLSSYLLRVRDLYGFGSFTGMAVHTAGGLLIASSGLLWQVRGQAPIAALRMPGHAGRAARIEAACGLLIPLLAGWLARLGYWHDLYSLDVASAMHVLAASLLHVSGALHLSAKIERQARAAAAAEQRALEAERRASESAARLERIEACEIETARVGRLLRVVGDP